MKTLPSLCDIWFPWPSGFKWNFGIFAGGAWLLSRATGAVCVPAAGVVVPVTCASSALTSSLFRLQAADASNEGCRSFRLAEGAEDVAVELLLITCVDVRFLGSGLAGKIEATRDKSQHTGSADLFSPVWVRRANTRVGRFNTRGATIVNS